MGDDVGPEVRTVTLLVDGRRALLEGLVDYAGLFPPASLDVESAVAEYRRARSGRHGWVLGRFVCPSSRLEDLAGLLTATMAAGEPGWGIAVVFDEPPGTAASHAASFDRHMAPAANVVVAEAKAPPEASDGRPVAAAAAAIAPVVDAAFAVSPEVMPFIEVVVGDAWETGMMNAIAAVADLHQRRLRPAGVKLRTGGSVPGAFPTPAQVAAFIDSSLTHRVPFKATAGLHEPVRHEDADLGAWRHGFLNLLVATALAEEGADPDDVTAAVAETDEAAFTVTAGGIGWRGRLLPVSAVRRVRHEIFPSYGSCSFDQPVDGLRRLGILAGTAV